MPFSLAPLHLFAFIYALFLPAYHFSSIRCSGDRETLLAMDYRRYRRGYLGERRIGTDRAPIEIEINPDQRERENEHRPAELGTGMRAKLHRCPVDKFNDAREKRT